MTVPEVEWPDWRSDVIEALRALADEELHVVWRNREPSTPSLTDAVHWLIDDSWFDTKSATSMVGRLFADEREAAGVDAAVSTLLVILDEVGPVQPDRAYLDHPNWQDVVSTSRAALAILTAQA